jgi:Na+/H+-dicarboxylate symporter
MDGFLGALEQLREMAADVAGRAATHLPALLGAVALLLSGWLIARWLRLLTHKLGAGLNRKLDRLLPADRARRIRLSAALVRLLSNLVFWIVILGFVTAAAEVIELDTLSRWLGRIVAYLPSLLVGALIIVAGYLIGAIVRDLVQDALDSAGIAQRNLIGRLAQAAAFLAAVVIGIDQIGIDVTFVTTMIAIVLGVVLAGFSLAFGLGARQSVANLIAARALQRQFSVGQRARLGDIEGEIIELTPTSVVLVTTEGRVHVPASHFEEQVSVLLPPDPAHG